MRRWVTFKRGMFSNRDQSSLKLNTKENWNSGVNYGFSQIRLIMSFLGIWLFPRNELLCAIHWFILFVLMLVLIASFYVEYFLNCGDPKDILEIVVIFEGLTHSALSILYPRLYKRKMTINMNSAIADWATLDIEERPHKIMMHYARLSRLIVNIHIVTVFLNIVSCIAAFLDTESQKVLIVNNDTLIMWVFPFPASCQFGQVSYINFIIISIVQLFLLALEGVGEFGNDLFFFCITMHLCGQLELLNNNFSEIKGKSNDKEYHARALRPLIIRHHQLISLANNIEESFCICIFIRFLLISVVIAMSGLSTINSLRQQQYGEVAKTALFIQFYIIQCFMFAYAGDTLQTQSELINTTIYDITWYELPSNIVKDLMLIMMRLKTPLRLSGAKFFYLTRGTITDIFKTTMSYISFLQVTVDT